MSAVNVVAWCIAMFCFLLILAVCLVQPSLGEVLSDGEVFQVYPDLEDVQNGTTPLYFALMQSFSGGYVSAGGIPGLMVALDEINSNSTVLPGYSLHYTLSDDAVGIVDFTNVNHTLNLRLAHGVEASVHVLCVGLGSASIQRYIQCTQSVMQLLYMQEAFQDKVYTCIVSKWSAKVLEV